MNRLTKRQWAFAALFVIAAAVCVRLGFWQMDRLSQRRATNARIEARMGAQPLRLSGANASAADLEFRRVVALGTFDPAHSITLANRARNDEAGVHLVTPLRLEGTDLAVLVDRGWIPAADSARQAWARYDVTGPVEINGIARASSPEPGWSLLADPTRGPGATPLDSWRVLNIDAIQTQIPYRLLPVAIEVTGDPQPGSPWPDPDIDLTDGPHLSYAVQWFSFAAIALIGGGLWLRHGLTHPSAVSSQE
ncbi:MAG: SURF1 family protein [Actinobacteria bacterium]|nr:SURF1 family protein [Actinomycetota bacterium]